MKKKKLFTVGTLALGTMAVTAPLSSIANDEVVKGEGPLFGDEIPTVYDVPNNPDFVVNQAVDGSTLTLTWDEVENAERYFVAKLYQIDSEYVLDGEPRYVTVGEFVDTIDPSQNYVYRIAPEVDGELQLDYVAVVTVSASGVAPEEETNEGENTNEENSKEDTTEEDSDVNEGQPSEKDEEEEQPKEEEQPNDEEQNEEEDSDVDEGEPSEEENKEDQPKEEEDLELTLEQLEQIDILAKEYAENVVESAPVENLYKEFIDNLKNDREFVKDFHSFFYNELTPFIEEKIDERKENVNLGNADQHITDLENLVNELTLDFFNENESFTKHLNGFFEKLEEIKPQLEPIVGDYDQLLAELVDEALLDEAIEIFDFYAEDYIVELSFENSLNYLESFMSILVEEPPVAEEEQKDEESKDDENSKNEDSEDDEKVNEEENKDNDSTDKDDDKEVPAEDEDKSEEENNNSDKDDKNQPVNDSEDNGNVDNDSDDKGNEVLAPEGNNNTPNGNTYVPEESFTEDELTNPSVPKTGDGSVQKVVSPLVASMLALVVAFILVPQRKRENA